MQKRQHIWQHAIPVGVVVYVAALTLSCRGTVPKVTTVDRASGRVTYYTSSDPRSALADLRQDGDVSETFQNLKTKLKSNPRDVVTLVSLAQVALMQGYLSEAEEYAKRTLKEDMGEIEARKVLAMVWLRRGNHRIAELVLNKLGGASSGDSDVLNMMGMVELRAGKSADAIHNFQASIAKNQANSASRMNLGVMYMKYKRLRDASVQFERVLASEANHVDARLHLATIQVARGQAQEAQISYDETLRKYPDNPLLLFNLAVFHKRSDRLDQALKYLSRYVDTPYGRSGDSQDAYALITEIQQQKRSSDEKVSDSQIQELAAKLSRPRESGTVPRDDRSEPIPPPQSVPNGSNQKRSGSTATAQQPAAAPHATPEPSQNEDIRELEKQLK